MQQTKLSLFASEQRSRGPVAPQAARQTALWTPRSSLTAPLRAGPSTTPAAHQTAAAARTSSSSNNTPPPRGARVRCAYTSRPMSFADQQRMQLELPDEDRMAQLVVANMRALSRLGRKCDEEAALDALLEERPMLLQLELNTWLQFLSTYGVKVRCMGCCAWGGAVHGAERLKTHAAACGWSQQPITTLRPFHTHTHMPTRPHQRRTATSSSC
jgi:hypothetical protein